MKMARHDIGWACLAMFSLFVLFWINTTAFAEAPQPGGFRGNENPPPPPPPDFEEDDYVDPGFGFNNPNGGPSNAAPPPSAANSAAPDFGTPAPRMGGPQNHFAPPPSAARGSSVAQSSGAHKEAPKLHDYLQLDSSVKALEVKNFDLPDKDIKDVVTLISKWTGKNFILDSKVRGKITILGPSQVTLQEAYQAFLSALDANGLTTVQSGKFIRIIDSAEARRAPVETYAGDYAPKTDQFITRIFQLKYINADEVQREFRDLTTRQGKLFAYEPTNSIIITDTGNNIARIQEILDTLDVKGFETTLHVMRIRNTSSKSIADMLGEIYGDKGQGNTNGPRTFRRSALERTRGGGIISKIIPDEQTNSLVVLANSAGFDQLKQLVAKLDIKVTDTGRIHVYYCEYAKAEDLAATLQSLSGGGSGAKKKSSPGAAPAGGPFGAGGPMPSTPTGSSGPVTAELEGNVKVTSDSATNSLVITANSGDYQTLKRVIKKLDIPRLQVYVETALLELAVDDNTNISTNIGIGAPNRAFAGGFIGNQDTVTNLLLGTPTAGLTAPIFAGPTYYVQAPGAAPGQTGVGTIPVNSFMGFLNLITTHTKGSVLSTPQIIALDNEKAEFKVLDEIPVLGSQSLLGGFGGTPGLPSGIPQGNIETKKVGITIKLTPHVNAVSKSIRLELEQKIDSVKTTGVPQALGSVQIATTSRETNTTVVVKDQNYIMLGGLMSEKVDEVVKKVPLLGDIPILGWLFKGKSTEKTKTNLVIVLHPRIISTSLGAANLVQDKLQQRDKFIEDELEGDDDYRGGSITEQMKHDVERQRRQSPTEPLEQYRNNSDEDIDTSHERPEQSELDTPRPSEQVKPQPSDSNVAKPPVPADNPAPKENGAEMSPPGATEKGGNEKGQIPAPPSGEPPPPLDEKGT